MITRTPTYILQKWVDAEKFGVDRSPVSVPHMEYYSILSEYSSGFSSEKASAVGFTSLKSALRVAELEQGKAEQNIQIRVLYREVEFMEFFGGYGGDE